MLCQNDGETQRITELIAEETPDAAIEVATQYLHRGFRWRPPNESSLALVTSHELLHRFHLRRRVQRLGGGRAVDAFIDLKPGDYVVHRDHGIARFIGLRTLSENEGGKGGGGEYLTLEFSGSAKLHVPASKIELVQKYIGAFKGKPELSVLGGKRWRNQKQKVAEAVRDLASEMLRLQALRETTPGIRYPADTTWQHEFEAEFPYEETDDQVAAIEAVKRDMAEPQPMDLAVS